MQLTLEQIASLAPDDSSLKAAQSLVSPGKWPTLGTDDSALWGECQGSGSKPYQVQMDFSGPAFRCSCPSRKFPCKHGLALALLRVKHSASFSANTPPAWVEEWLASRRQKAEQREQKQAQPAPPPDPKAAAKREAKRRETMAAGAEELQRWMADLVRQGLGNLRGGNVNWRALAGRMVDAKATGLARRVQMMESLAASPEAWAVQVLAAMGQTQCLLEGFSRFDSLSPAQQADLRTAMGWPLEKEEVLRDDAQVKGNWAVLGIAYEETDRLWERRVWLAETTSGQRALILDYAHGNRVFEQLFLVGSVYPMSLAFYPSQLPRRALVLDVQAPATLDTAPPSVGLADEFERIADAVAANPWISTWPLQFDQAQLVYDTGLWWAVNQQQTALPLRIGKEEAWVLMALAAGQPLQLFGEWDGKQFAPLTASNGFSTQPLWTYGGPL